MKTQLKTLDGPVYNVDLDDVSGIEMRGTRDSVTGWVVAKLYIRSGAVIDNARMMLSDYDKLVEDWSAPEEEPPAVEEPQTPTN